MKLKFRYFKRFVWEYRVSESFVFCFRFFSRKRVSRRKEERGAKFVISLLGIDVVKYILLEVVILLFYLLILEFLFIWVGLLNFM